MSDAKKILFEIVTPEQTVLREEIVQITVPTKMGEITILPNHIPLVATLRAGVIEVILPNGMRDVMSLSGGFIEVLKDKIVILADSAERAEELDVERIEKAKKAAEEAIKDVRHIDKEMFANISASLAKELARSKAHNRWKKIKGLDK